MWEARAYTEGDEEQLAALFTGVFGKPVSPEWWRWKLKSSRSPVQNVWVAVATEEEAGRIVGQYAGIPVRVQLQGSVRAAMVSVDTMTSPDFRRKGILSKLGAIAYSEWASAGMAAVLGLPNEQWGSRTGALGWVKLFPLRWLRLRLRLDELVSRSERVPRPLLGPARLAAYVASYALRVRRTAPVQRPRIVRIREVTRASAAFDQLWGKLAGAYANMMVRDSDWVRWRYLEAVGTPYHVLVARSLGELTGYIAYKVEEAQGRATGYIADLFTAPNDAIGARALVRAALDAMWKRGVGTVLAAAVPGSALDGVLRSIRFAPMPPETAFSAEMVPLDESLDIASISDPSTWLMTAGDFDVV